MQCEGMRKTLVQGRRVEHVWGWGRSKGFMHAQRLEVVRIDTRWGSGVESEGVVNNLCTEN